MQYGMLFSGPVFIRTVGHSFDQFSIDVGPAFFSLFFVDGLPLTEANYDAISLLKKDPVTSSRS